MPEALPLVVYNETNHTFQVESSTLQRLSTLFEPLAVVSIAGLFRTGKSFLLNRIILHEPGSSDDGNGGSHRRVTTRRSSHPPPVRAGFGVGNTVQACTKGIWMWSEPLVVKDDQGRDVNVIVLDTEGSGAPSANATHDARVSSLGLLLSSYFVYNSVGRIDDAALSTLTTVTHITSNMREDETDALPGFLWLLRDFALQLENKEGESVDADAYMEEQLSGDKNDARAHLRTYFKDRGCATLIRPVMEENDLQNLNTLSDTALRPEFVKAAKVLRARILSSTANRPLRHNNTHLNGDMLGEVVCRYVDAVNAGAVPHIADAWESVCAVQLAHAERDILGAFPSTLDALFADASEPPSVMRTRAQHALADAVTQFETRVARFGGGCMASHDVLEQQVDARVETYTTSWTRHVEAYAATLVDTALNKAKSGVNETLSWSSFWDEAVTVGVVHAFQTTYGSEESVMFLLLRAMQRLWDVVPVFFGDTPLNAQQVKHMETRMCELEEEVHSVRRAAEHDMESMQLRVQGANKRACLAEEEYEQMQAALLRAQEEVRSMTEDVMDISVLRSEHKELQQRVHELEEALSASEDEAARKATEANHAALQSVEAVKELRASDAKRYELEVATAHESRAQEVASLKQDMESLSLRARASLDQVKQLTKQLDDASLKNASSLRELRARDDAVRGLTTRITELERQLADADERARKRPRGPSGGEGDALKLVRAETELGFLRTQKNDLSSALSTSKARCTDLERQIRSVQRTADETVQRERLKHETMMAQMEMRFSSQRSS